MSRTFLLVAGGTGGHLFPAEALAGVLVARGHKVALVTDGRALGYGVAFSSDAIHTVPSATFGSKHPAALARSAWRIVSGLTQSARLIRRLKPAVVVGFGGYPSLPPVLAAQLLGVPTAVHEQNAVLGRANRALAARATRVATGFTRISKAADNLRTKMIPIGNPIRAAVRELAATPYAAPTEGEIRLVVFGGSQGARVMSEVVPAAVARLSPAIRSRLTVIHQARAEDRDLAVSTYEKAGVRADVAPFFTDLPVRIAAAHLVVSRAGASTVAELGAIGRPAILVPLPGSLDQDQFANGSAFADAGGGTVVRQSDLTSEKLSGMLMELFDNPHILAAQAASAKTFGTLDAADRLADLVEEIAGAETRTKT
ncbi:UDP-N-acetylglucosamine--N-acetylmuramyl-(pentapeptide) pyrophosphoryl-undecaprenol N-acetylglucosamine transferase [Agaricicola taiwanensis]|uniref:UDP-N-acetylglucosamine--N-acetylmuramyl-(pentapeptide) pyrophosphoryl-undecaprenol N-acetylglucosamine transferase n=1 Tax=Agaricicola taiwanensis TaxID=591372 RepID=A0A8J2YHA4_9RHOB|nr:undecaprenyldiphospho-muramoylpentapeptide beta-N-acetylglucosaminyltransferase [Agaricicola taiwanensis]GGE42331.1 UDP-N-acetylglucosamine--N-acetylmuramyl-(pentapeptide) pyrophosphoryl-undecaprenol N-acetylglucosamine transferase [Agaricicola taiwanensis]